ncbi:MAG: hypothetical protein A2289_03825 [Deltaproteobacteria bacterium RIFOXYA12_FULL_58_15]|nr:MAG: hypothetical protein A2289_03825 [Deltaproteobacteria bacterium RIFOXYA12_FULL_58_15]
MCYLSQILSGDRLHLCRLWPKDGRKQTQLNETGSGVMKSTHLTCGEVSWSLAALRSRDMDFAPLLQKVALFRIRIC